MDFFISGERPHVVLIVGLGFTQSGHPIYHQDRIRYSLGPGPIMQLPGPPTRPPAHRNLSKDSLYPGASPYEDVSSTRSPSMAHRNERRTHDGERLFDTESDGVCDLKDFANKENWMDVMDSLGQVSTTQSNQQGPYSLGWKTLRDYLESPTITIDNVKSKIHGTPHDSIASWCFGIMSILAFATMILLGGPTSVYRLSASGIIVRLVFILGTQPLWKHEASIQAGRDPEDTTKQRAARCFLIESRSPVHQASSRRALLPSESR